MGAVDTTRIFDEIRSLVRDKLQVVSYKWLSRKFSLSSNDAKRTLKDFVDAHGTELEVVYALSGWLKHKPQNYSVILIPKDKIFGAQEEFKDGSLQVYSVQASLPKDPATLVSAEYVQSEELFSEHLNSDNCLWDNRYGAISNSFVKRNDDTQSFHVASLETKNGVGISVSSANNNRQTKITEPKQLPPSGPQTSVGLSKDTKKMENDNAPQGIKPHVDNGKISAVAASKKDYNGKSSSVGAGSLANLWGRASSKPKDTPKNIVEPIMTSDAQIHAYEENAVVSSDDNDDDEEYRRRDSNGSSKRKRRVVFDFSDEDEDETIISLASPEPPKSLTNTVSGGITDGSRKDTKEMDIDEQAVDIQKVTPAEKGTSMKDTAEGPSTSMRASEVVPDVVSKGLNKGHDEKKSETTSIAPQRRKVLKTRIDDRGREVTEVVWEGENGSKNVDSAINEAKDKNVDSVTTAKDNKNENNLTKKSSENRTVTATNAAPSPVNAAPPSGSSKFGTKKTKGNVKDVKQGSIMSFFKKAS